MTPATPKSHVLLARQAPVAVIFYRKSRLTTYCLHLDYERRKNGCRDRLSKGSRFYGRLFPERSDLSPDGSLMIYFAMRGKRTAGKSDPSTWTALCSPPWLKAHLFFPNGSTWGGGGVFLRDRRLVVFDTPPKDAGPEYDVFRHYEILRDIKSLPAGERAILEARFRSPAVATFPQPSGGRAKPVLVRTARTHRLGSYEQFDYVLKDAAGYDIDGAEEIVLANWAGWDIFGRLLVAAGRHLNIYEVKPGRPLPEPAKSLDLEAVL
ncbi:hypothetical protein [Taklimakanibacter deserti]|uniref:hypothetical protein n=1 Tax=Taklimakanibacter deserti TaxID=2267839 RepID=UPI000E64F230